MSHNGICNVKECLWNGREHPKGDLSAPDPMSTKKEKCNHDEFVRGQVGEECLECGLLRSTIDNIGSHSQSESEWENEFDEKFTGLAWHTNPMDGKLKSFIENLLEQERKKYIEEGFQDGIGEFNQKSFSDGVACGIRDERRRLLTDVMNTVFEFEPATAVEILEEKYSSIINK